MNDRVRQFKDAALGAGYDPKEVDAFIGMIPSFGDEDFTPSGDRTSPDSETTSPDGDKSQPPVVPNSGIIQTPSGKQIVSSTPKNVSVTAPFPLNPFGGQQPQIKAPGGLDWRLDPFGTRVQGEAPKFNPTAMAASRPIEMLNKIGSIPGQVSAMTVKKGTDTKRVVPPDTEIYNNFGSKSRKLWKSGGGKHWGTDYKMEVGTPLSVPEGDWEVVEARGGSKSGYLGNKDNAGYGNTMVVENRKTGERLRYSHLSEIDVKPGQLVKSGDTVALSGNTGNSNAPHLDAEYMPSAGKWSDIRKSPYKQYF